MSVPACKEARIASKETLDGGDLFSRISADDNELSPKLLEHLSGSRPMSSNRRFKKRESDRRCQRMSRERTKSHIAYLEDLVEKLKQADASGQIGSLVQSMSQLRQERNSLANKLKSIENILLPQTGSTMERTPKTEEPGSQPPESESLTSFHALHPIMNDSAAPFSGYTCQRIRNISANQPAAQSVEERSVIPHQLREVSEGTCTSFSTTPAEFHGGSSQLRQPQLIPSNMRASFCECGYAEALKKQELNFWYMGNTNLGAWMKWPTLVTPVSDDDLYNDDTPIRAMVQGWDAVDKRGNVHPMWRLIRVVDENLFTFADDPKNRLGILYNVGRLLRAHLDPTRQQITNLPPFFVDRPHLRQALAKNIHRYCRNHFWRTFISSLRMQWPYEFRDCFLFNSANGLYKINPMYAEILGDIRRIGVTKDFFNSYPEFRSAIGAVDEIPASITVVQNQYANYEGLPYSDLFKQRQPESKPDESKKAAEPTEQNSVGQMMASLFNHSYPEQVESWDYGIWDHGLLPEMSYISGRDFL
ncbi:uncharacterized protein Z518_01349 [Rhinocladiella mackenziei CBS 650.93]|uniref:BZIP domain-containing protein n=1 Tax=Rhinocladiella mackenziei CBS 650.93 TaxID=1442369 RepID=A0A0D2G5R9_9EURO|nr:uncharacterized protein Z518_01349 [Rhinocladiella mackenziei CBS 650.93]KIX10267.1 hypothetical protein Z518_01349 [Rhinocladiella mackenziei CBS 650.93]